MIYIIDHKDSFTHNRVHQFSNFDNVECDNFNKIDKKKLTKADVIVFSPGPGSPKNYPIRSSIYKKFKGKKKIIGICLGFQQILYCEKGKIIQQKKIYHGYQSQIKVTSDNSLFKKNRKFNVGRYHSWVVEEPIPDCLEILAYDENKQIMALKHKNYDIRGVQFHPESILTEEGKALLNNWLKIN